MINPLLHKKPDPTTGDSTPLSPIILPSSIVHEGTVSAVEGALPARSGTPALPVASNMNNSNVPGGLTAAQPKVTFIFS